MSNQNLKQAIDCLDQKTLKQELFKALKLSDEAYAQFFAKYVDHHGGLSEDEISHFQKIISKLIDRYLTDDYLSYNQYCEFSERFATKVLEPLEEALTKETLTLDTAKDIFKILIDFCNEIVIIDIFDEEGDLFQLLDDVLDVVGKAVNKAKGTDYYREMYDKAQDLYHISGKYFDYDDIVKEFIERAFDTPEYVQPRLDSVEQKLADLTEVDSNNNHRLLKLVLKKHTYLKQLNRPQEEIDEFLHKYWEFPEVRALKIKDYEDNEDYDNLIKLLLESKEMDQNNDQYNYQNYIIPEYHEKLINAYEKTNHFELVKAELAEYLKKPTTRHLVEYFKKYKKFFSEEDWKIERESIFKSKTDYDLLNLYLEEQLFDRMMKSILNAESNYSKYSFASDYEKYLKELYPQELFKIYQDYCAEELKETTNRGTYYSVAQILKKMKTFQLNDANERVEGIKAKFIKTYHKRSAMIDELNKI